MVSMHLLTDAEVRRVEEELGLPRSLHRKVYLCKQPDFDNLVVFTLADYMLTVEAVICNKADPLLYDFLVKGVLGYGEQHMALDVTFGPALDDRLLHEFGFLKADGKRTVRLYTLAGGCNGCKSAGHSQP